MSRKISRPITIPVPGVKDASGAYTVQGKDLSIDSLLLDCLAAIHGVVEACRREASNGNPSREAVMNLKDAVSMLNTLKDKENELLQGLSDEDLRKVADGEYYK